MSTSTPAVGIDHPTVVPANFDPEGRSGELDADESERDVDGSAADADGSETDDAESTASDHVGHEP
jgi:hypothetical protein